MCIILSGCVAKSAKRPGDQDFMVSGQIYEAANSVHHLEMYYLLHKKNTGAGRELEELRELAYSRTDTLDEYFQVLCELLVDEIDHIRKLPF